MDNQKIQTYFFGFLLLATTVLMVLVFYPFIGILAIAAVLALTSRSLFEKINSILKIDWLASLVVILILSFFVIIPLFFIGWQIFIDAQSLYLELSANKFTYLEKINDFIEKPLQNFIPSFTVGIESYIEKTLKWFVSNMGLLVSGAAKVMFNIILVIVVLFFFLKDNFKIKKALILISPLEDKYDELIFKKLDLVVNSVVRGTLFVAVIQGLAAGIGFWIFGIPSPTFLGAITAMASLVPGLGTSIIIFPATIYLLLNGSYLAALGLALWGIAIVGLIDELLRTIVYKNGIPAHPIIIFFAIFGGVYLFGPMGVIFGPIVLSFYITLLEIYKTFAKAKEQ